MNYSSFRFIGYDFDRVNKTLLLRYGYDDDLHFEEKFQFDFAIVDYDPDLLEIALQHLFLMAGISYYKAYLAPHIRVEQGEPTTQLRHFLETTYQKGLGEFWYVNRLDPRTPVTFPAGSGEHKLDNAAKTSAESRLLVGIGGGKDSLVSVELLKNTGFDVATWSLGHRKQLTPLVKRVGLTHYWVDRTWDRRLLDLNKQGAYNGHVPISAIIACVGTVVAILTGRSDHIVSNEQSANEPTLTYQGIAINHQYSKSQEFEAQYQQVLSAEFGGRLRYYSLLRPLSELRISELFAKTGFDSYHDVFSSCNRAFTHDSPGLYWDGSCPKCAFVFLALTPFIARSKLETLFGGKNLLLDSALRSTYEQLLGIAGDKPLECVGEVKESREAMRHAQRLYPELNSFNFEIPDGYDFRQLSSHHIPARVWEQIKPLVQ